MKAVQHLAVKSDKFNTDKMYTYVKSSKQKLNNNKKNNKLYVGLQCYANMLHES